MRMIKLTTFVCKSEMTVEIEKMMMLRSTSIFRSFSSEMLEYSQVERFNPICSHIVPVFTSLQSSPGGEENKNL